MAIETQATYTYEATTGRLGTVSGGALQAPSPFTYTYVPNSSLLQTVTGPVHTVTNQYEPSRDVLASKENKAGTTTISKYDYLVNTLGQRTNVSTSGTAFPATPSWAWGYDSLGQVISADSSVNTSDRAYEYDVIGNRKRSADSLNLPIEDNYTSNALNQYSSIGNLQSPIVNPLHDDDGNMTSGQLPTGSAGLVWDAENRLIAVSVIGQDTIHYAYDAQSRRISRSVGVSPTAFNTLYIYDAWNPIAEYSGTSLSKTYLWGTDLSGSQQGAGGVGGLLSINIHDPQSTIYYPTYDGNGNVSEYLASNASTVAHFEYDPFGNTVVNTDTAGQFGYRFSTKPLDSETGLYYYGYRWYAPFTGRWPSRDPIEERGGVNLYGFVGNAGVTGNDYLGLTIKLTISYETLANIWATYGVYAYTGDATNVGLAMPVPSETDEFDRKKQGTQCCAKVKKAQTLTISVHTALPSDWGNPTLIDGKHTAFSKAGYDSTVKHEFRRRSVYTKANQAFLVPAEKSGAQATKCGWVCRNTYAEAEVALSKYLGDLRKESETDYKDYVEAEQLAIGGEGTGNDGWEDWGLGFNVWVLKPFTSIHKIKNPKPLWDTICP